MDKMICVSSVAKTIPPNPADQDHSMSDTPLETLLHGDITRQIIGAAFEVHRVLGYGFLERVYQRSLQVELAKSGVKASLDQDIVVHCKGIEVGHYRPDLLVADVVAVELKVSKEYCTADEAQLLNSLKASNMRVGLLINFGRTKVEFKRFVL